MIGIISYKLTKTLNWIEDRYVLLNITFINAGISGSFNIHEFDILVFFQFSSIRTPLDLNI